MIKLTDLDLQNISGSEIGELLIKAKKAYYTSDKPIMDDHTFDTLEDILKKKNPYHRIFNKIGTPNFDTGFQKKKHTLPMFSQNKASTYTEMSHYFELKKIPNNSQFIVQPKCDGLSLEIEYKNGQLVDAITRGDGKVGDIITQNVVKMKGLVPNLPKDFSGSIRCEIVVTKKDFFKLNKIAKGEGSVYSNPRNAASGLSQRLDGKYSELCTLMAVDIVSTNHQFSAEMDKIDYLKNNNIIVVETHICQNFSEIEEIYQQFLNTKRQDYPYEIDGLVIKINDLKIQKELGSHQNRPKGQLAYKFPASSDTTEILEINWQVGPMGSITPVAKVTPIEISGAIITYASLANHDLVQKMNINVGDLVKISRRGDVIPHIESLVNKISTTPLEIPQFCPNCQNQLIKTDKYLKCPNKNCLGQTLGRLKLFCATLDILGISDKTIEKLYQAGKVHLPGDFFKLNIDDIAPLDNLGEKSAKNIIGQIQAKRDLSLVEVFDSAIIPHFSSQRIKQVFDAGFDTPKKIFELTIDDLLKLPGFKETLAQKIIDGINSRHEEIESIINQVKIKFTHQSQKLKNLNFSITGDLSLPRKQVVELIENNGGKFLSAVTSNTDYLLTNQSDSNSSKFKSAQKFGTKIIGEKQFFALLDN
jgi:DNA ligase (NAD+)